MNIKFIINVGIGQSLSKKRTNCLARKIARFYTVKLLFENMQTIIY